MSLPWRFDPLGVMGALVPVSGTRGVFWLTSSAGSVVSSAMTINGGTVGQVASDYPGARMEVYSRGKAVSQTVVSGGVVVVLSGGMARATYLAEQGAQLTVSSGGAASGTVTRSTLFSVRDGGIAYAPTLRGAGQIQLNGTAYDAVVSGGVISCISGAVSRGTMYGGGIRVSAYAEGVVVSGGIMNVHTGGVASNIIVSGGGSMTVSSGGAALEVTSETEAIVTVLEGGTITYKQ